MDAPEFDGLMERYAAEESEAMFAYWAAKVVEAAESYTRQASEA